MAVNKNNNKLTPTNNSKSGGGIIEGGNDKLGGGIIEGGGKGGTIIEGGGKIGTVVEGGVDTPITVTPSNDTKVVITDNGEIDVTPVTPVTPNNPTDYKFWKNNCFNLIDYGNNLTAKNFKWKQEVINYLSDVNVKSVSILDDVSSTVILTKLTEQTPGKKYILKCTDYYVENYLCYIKSVKYINIKEYNINLAQFYIDAVDPVTGFVITPVIVNGKAVQLKGIKPAYYIVGVKGRLCELVEVDDDDRVPETGGPIWPGDDDDDNINIGSGEVYTKIDDFDSINRNKTIITKGLWSEDKNILLNYYIDTNQDATKLDYLLEVYYKPIGQPCNEVQFNIIYADYDGKGSKDLGGLDNETMTKAMYTQYANILLPHNQNKFIINNEPQDYVYIIDVKRDRYKTSMDPGNWELSMYSIEPNDSGSLNNSTPLTIGTHSGSFWSGSMIDSSVELNGDIELTNKVYSIGYGQLENRTVNLDIEVGKFYQNFGILVLSGKYLDQSFGFATNRNIERHGCNPYRMWLSLQSAVNNVLVDSSGDRYGFKGRSLNIEHNKFYFIRVRSYNNNYSNNPTYVTGSEGDIIPDFIYKEQAYITSIGLYNENKELLAVGKLPKAYLKKISDEILFKVKVSH